MSVRQVAISYENATASADDRVDFPEYVEGFLALGFEQVGRVIPSPSATPLLLVAEHHHADRRANILGHLSTPIPVLRSPNTPAFVDISWFFDSPSVRMRTQFEDGYLVETLRRWDSPPWHKQPGTIDKLMLKNHAPHLDRSTRLVASSSVLELWAAHHDHVKELRRSRHVAPLPHADLAGFISLATATDKRDRRYWISSAERRPAGQNRTIRRSPMGIFDLGGVNQFLIFVGVLVVATYALLIVMTAIA